MQHFKIDSVEKAEEISRKMWQIMNPGNVETTHLFPWAADDSGQAYITLDLDMVCPIYVNNNFAQVVSDVGKLLNIPENEGAELKNYLQSGLITLKNIIPSTLQEYEPVFNTKNIYQ